jgi:hypothetical protein
MNFDEWLESYVKTYKYNKSFIPTVDMRTSWEAAKELYQPKWISVNDRLPEAEGFYPAKTTLSTSFVKQYYDTSIKKFDVNMRTNEKVTHWMEIPE